MRIYSNSPIGYNSLNKKSESSADNTADFQSILNKTQEVSFSKHASMRLDSRRISFSDEQLKRVENGVSEAASKGIKDALVIVDDAALVVNVKNRIVVTAVENQNNSVFTNIDGAVIV